MKTNKFDVGKRIGTVTHMPCWILGLMGRIDSLKCEESIPNAKVNGMKEKCMALEKREALVIEQRYESDRKDGAKALLTMRHSLEIENSTQVSEIADTPYQIRINARAAANKASAKAMSEQAHERLTEVAESLVHGDTVLSERIRKTREKALNVKIAAYVKGVRKGKLPGYAPELTLADDAYEIYKSKHAVGDNAIFDAVGYIENSKFEGKEED